MFSSDYSEARDRFRRLASERGGTLHAWEVIPADNGQAEGLTIDAAVFGTGTRTLIVSSGLHGVEGFAGSAIQLDMLTGTLPDDIKVVLIHAINPFGMAHIRRVNENNVDLNRNFLGPLDPWEGCSDHYRRLRHLLNPRRPTGGIDVVMPQILAQIAMRGFGALKAAVVEGQYDYPKGLYFGGFTTEAGPTLLLQSLPRLVQPIERVVHIDVHTGLGRSGSHALFVAAEAGSADHLRLRAVYGDRVQPWDVNHGLAYRIRGGLPEAMRRLLGPAVDVITCEFGTHAPLHVLKALRLENQQFHWGGDRTSAEAALLEAFRPDSKSWETSVLEGGRSVLNRAIEHLRA